MFLIKELNKSISINQNIFIKIFLLLLFHTIPRVATLLWPTIRYYHYVVHFQWEYIKYKPILILNTRFAATFSVLSSHWSIGRSTNERTADVEPFTKYASEHCAGDAGEEEEQTWVGEGGNDEVAGHSGLTYSRVFRLPVITLTQNGAKAEQNTNCKISIFFKCIIGQLMPNFGWDFGAPIGSQITP